MLEVRLLGQFDVRLDSQPVLIASRHAQSLLAHHLLNPRTAHRRERLAGLLWPDISEANARRNLRQELWRIRMALDPAGTRVVGASSDGTARVWDAATGQLLHTLAGHTGEFWGVAISPDGMHLATSSSGRTVRLWDIPPGWGQREEPLTLHGHTGSVSAAAYSPDGKRLATASRDEIIRVWALSVEDLEFIAKPRVTRTLATDECQKLLRREQCPPGP